MVCEPAHPMFRGKVLNDPATGLQSWRIFVSIDVVALALMIRTDSEIVYRWYWIGTVRDFETRCAAASSEPELPGRNS